MTTFRSHLKTAFIINPAAGGPKKAGLRKRVIGKISALFPDSPIAFTSGPKEAASIVRDLLGKGYECIAAVGGDGTINSVVEGFFIDEKGTPVKKGAALGVIPIGTGGDFRRTMGIEDDPLSALSLLRGDSVKPCDVGIVEFRDFGGQTIRRYFVNIASFGLSGLVDKYVQESSKNLGGTVTFFLSTLKALRVQQNPLVEVTIDEKEKKTVRSALVVTANGRFFGGGMQIAPVADIADGLLEVVIIGDLHLWDFIKGLRMLYGGRVLAHPEVFHRPARKVEITPLQAEGTMYTDLDGEPIGTIPARIEVIQSAINLKI